MYQFHFQYHIIFLISHPTFCYNTAIFNSSKGLCNLLYQYLVLNGIEFMLRKWSKEKSVNHVFHLYHATDTVSRRRSCRSYEGVTVLPQERRFDRGSYQTRCTSSTVLPPSRRTSRCDCEIDMKEHSFGPSR